MYILKLEIRSILLGSGSRCFKVGNFNCFNLLNIEVSPLREILNKLESSLSVIL